MDWPSVIQAIARLGLGVEVELDKQWLLHPSKVEGFKLSLGMPRGQVADYRMRLSDGRCLHVVELRDRYLVHLDSVDPSDNPLGHLLSDTPPWLASLAIAASLPIAGAQVFLKGFKEIATRLLSKLHLLGDVYRKMSTPHPPSMA